MSTKLSVKDASRLVSEFDGKNLPLIHYFNELDEARGAIDSRQEENLVRFIKTKLTGKAKTYTLNFNIKTIKQLKDQLMNVFSTRQSKDQLHGELGSISQEKNESIHDYVYRMYDIANNMLSAYKEEKDPSAEKFDEYRNTTKEIMKDCFRKGLKSEIEIRLEKNIATLEDLIKKAGDI